MTEFADKIRTLQFNAKGRTPSRQVTERDGRKVEVTRDELGNDTIRHFGSDRQDVTIHAPCIRAGLTVNEER